MGNCADGAGQEGATLPRSGVQSPARRPAQRHWAPSLVLQYGGGQQHLAPPARVGRASRTQALLGAVGLLLRGGSGCPDRRAPACRRQDRGGGRGGQGRGRGQEARGRAGLMQTTPRARGLTAQGPSPRPQGKDDSGAQKSPDLRPTVEREKHPDSVNPPGEGPPQGASERACHGPASGRTLRAADRAGDGDGDNPIQQVGFYLRTSGIRHKF